MTEEMTPLREESQLDIVLEEPLAILYKHSPLCGLSGMAIEQVRKFVRANPDVPVYTVDVIRDRRVSQEVERRLEVRHESPQVFVLRGGEVAWHGSHRSVTAPTLERETA